MFRVRWERNALDELTRMWTAANSVLRKAITAASADIDSRLGADPLGHGESRPAGRRVLLVAPLGVTYRVEAEGVTVSVLRVWLFRKRGQP